MIKQIIKKVITALTSKLNHIYLIGEGHYIGLNIKVVNRGVIIFHDKVTVRPSCTFFCNESHSKIDLGFGVEIGNHSTLSSMNLIIIEDYVLTGPHVFISDHNHKYADPSLPISQQGVSCKKDDRIVIGEGSWLGTNVVIIGNVRIGKHCVIGANSVVTKDIPDYCVAVGMPAKIIKKI